MSLIAVHRRIFEAHAYAYGGAVIQDLAIGSYRFSVSRLIPEMTQVALKTHKKNMRLETPNRAKRKFLYRLSRSNYEKEWGKDCYCCTVARRTISSEGVFVCESVSAVIITLK